ncbi:MULTISPECIES: helix-turn-helix domain-containing protein [Catenuloplanes]|uniref:Transcriptional regulator with XRE-family HTH domain n=1 Tax=Catenuloplanes niger TaxID=587534 RepID=A0AAE4CS76_9ACTN|nr:helix-turn-helix domain-containing protein [Catenuloplanes niger]MDR7320938.1 transcriptional regulator with XRE-family HTH domain [Catenuloplanes niger]
MARRALVRSGADFGVAIAEARAIRGLTQVATAELATVERTYLARIEAGATTLLLDRILRILRRLGAEVIVLLPEEDPDSRP